MSNVAFVKANILNTLLSVEAEYVRIIEKHTQALNGIRVAIGLERESAGSSPLTPETPNPEESPPKTQGWLTGLSNKAGAQAVLEKVGGGMALVDLMAAMKEGGHPVAGNRALSVALSSNKDIFVSRNGKWFLTEPPLPSAASEKSEWDDDDV